jgi:transcriptional regulator with XRE-family HTH domain
MNYATDHFATALKNAREAKGLSQRALSELVGVPQSHISKIESGTVDVRVSSLVALARVLELELTLVPRKSVPAVDSIIRSTSGAPRQLSSATRKAWKNVQAKLDRISHADPTNTEFAQVQRLARDLEHLGFAVVDHQTLRDVNKRVDAVLERRDADGVHRLLVEFKNMRNAAAHDAGSFGTTTKVRPAYSLEESSDGE